MFSRIVPLCVVFLLFAAFTPAQDAKKELEALQGDWTMVSLEQKGEKKEALKVKLAIKEDQWILASNNNSMTIKIDPSKNPKTIDFTYQAGGKEVLSQGIYKLEGDLLTMCRTTGINADRPKAFKTTDDDGILVVWKREKK